MKTSIWSIRINFSGLVYLGMKNICGKFRCEKA